MGAVLQHTPGPWIANQYEDGDPDGGPNGEFYFDGTFSALRRDGDDYRLEDVSLTDEANARLIAAAPDLLAALRALLSQQPNYMAKSEEVAMARAAISRAEASK